MFCPSCGAKNPDDARFCNMCGTALAAPSANTTMRGAGPRATPPSGDARASRSGAQAPSRGPLGDLPQSDEAGVSSVSLSAIVQSPVRVWGTILGGAALLLALGVLGGWLVSRGSQPAAEVPPDTAAAPMEIGLPTAVDEHAPTGEAVPEEDAPPAPGPGTTSDRTGRDRADARARNAASTRPSGTGPSPSPGARTSGRTQPNRDGFPPPGTAGSSEAAYAGREQAEARPTPAGPAGGGSAPADPTPSGGTTGEPVAGDPAAGTEEEERDLMLDLYATRVRRYIRTYYAGRAQSCFDRAARVNDGLRGTVLVTFTIKEAGGTEGVRVTRNTTGDDVLANCLVNQVREWDLPGPPGGALELSMPFSR
jgi:outer membrane biosynthesis protein TonB